ncbi:MAG: hypothetical protein Q8P57_04160 [Candidatus Pacearchaeota archaeon]|nr:hypothetical protein [Candidatus Pacearchaeota archaeon]
MILNIIILLLAIPVGFLISWLSRDELINGKKYIKILFIASILGIIGFWIYGFSTASWSSGFMGIVSLIGLIKSEDKRWVKKREI